MKRVNSILAFALGAAAMASACCGQTARASGYEWAGPYAGGNLGASWNDATFGAQTATALTQIGPLSLGIPRAQIDANERLTGGAQAGYNFQRNRLVVGMEGDFQAGTSRLGTSSLVPLPYPVIVDPAAAFLRREVATDWVGSVRLRVGGAWNRFLAYGPAGAAFTELKASARGIWGLALNPSILESIGLAAPAYSQSRFRPGLALGGGAEWAVTDAISLGLEGRHVRFDGAFDLGSHPSATANLVQGASSITFAETEVTVRINYHFGR
jgi:outer membrane immunogenic protein